MDIRILPSEVHETEIEAPASKSFVHRVLIAAALTDGTSSIAHVTMNRDIEATASVLRHLGASIQYEDGTLHVQGIHDFSGYDGQTLDCDESGSTLRFLIPILSLTGRQAVFKGHGRLMQRPQSVYEKVFSEQHLQFVHTEDEIIINGKLQAGRYQIDGGVSSQFISGLLFALPLLEKDSVIEVTGDFASRSYVNLTVSILIDAGIHIDFCDRIIRIPGSQKYACRSCQAQADDSSSAFFACLAAMHAVPLSIVGMNRDSLQADHAIVSILKKMGAEVNEEKNRCTFHACSLHATEIDLSDCPDLGPVLFALACVIPGKTVFHHTERLRIKESDRVECMRMELQKMGCDMQVGNDTVVIEGVHSLHGAVLDGHNDHRIVMALSVLASMCETPSVICGAEAVQKSYPNFFRDLNKTGIRTEEIK